MTTFTNWFIASGWPVAAFFGLVVLYYEWRNRRG